MPTITIDEDELIQRYANCFTAGFKQCLRVVSTQMNKPVNGKPFIQPDSARKDLDFLLSMIQTSIPQINAEAFTSMKEKANEQKA